jgi:hypothetical protein
MQVKKDEQMAGLYKWNNKGKPCAGIADRTMPNISNIRLCK